MREPPPNELLITAKKLDEDSRQAWVAFLEDCAKAEVDSYKWLDVMRAATRCELNLRTIAALAQTSPSTVTKWNKGVSEPGKLNKWALIPLLIEKIKANALEKAHERDSE